MKLLTGLLSCLLALFGCDTRPSVTSITRASENGVDVLFSKTTLAEGAATFECFASRSGGCHYRIYEERCEGAAGAANEAGACTRKTLDAFALTVGKRRQVEGLPTAFRLCVGEDDASGCG